jgi:hypothetical protein
MRTRNAVSWLLAATALLSLAGCGDDGTPGRPGQDGRDATVYYSEWFSPAVWSGVSGDWFFTASAPDLTEDIVEGGVILAYVWLEGDLYDGNAVRPLPAFAVGANWSFLVHEYGFIEFTSDMIAAPATTGNFFRFIAIPGTIPALKSAPAGRFSEEELKSMSYEEICAVFAIPE